MVGRENRCPAEVRQHHALNDTCRSLMPSAMSQLRAALERRYRRGHIPGY